MEYPFTPVPNWFFPLARHLTESELRIMLVIWDQTVGFAAQDGTRQVSNTLAYTFLQQQTGISSRSTISASLKHLEELSLITRLPKRMHGQSIEVAPKSPVSPVPLVHSVDSESPVSGLSESSEKTHRKKPPKRLFKESNTMEKFTQDQEESLQMLVGVGIDKDISRQLIVKAWENGRDSEYIKQVVGYVNSISAKNPPGMVRTLIERNSGRIPTSNAAQGPTPKNQGFDASKFDHGGSQHKLVESSCPICHPSMVNRVEVNDEA